MRILIVLFLTLAFSLSAFSQRKKTNYRYKKYEKFDFNTMDIEGANASPGDVSVSPRVRRKFRNKLPNRRNFHPEMKKAIDSTL